MKRPPLLALLLVGLSTGCAYVPFKPLVIPPASSSSKTASTGETKVDAGGEGFALGDVERSGLSPQQLVDRVAGLLRDAKPASAMRLAESFPDVGLTILREPDTVHAASEAMTVIAQAQDKLSSQAGPPDTWVRLIEDRRNHAERYAEYDNRRRQFMEHLQRGRVREALDLRLHEIAKPAGPQAVVDAVRLRAIGLVLADRPQDAVNEFNQAVGMTEAWHPYQAVSLLLLLSDAQRRAGDTAGSETNWQRAVQAAAELACGPLQMVDPVLWERAAYLRPVQSPWPPSVQERLAGQAAKQGITPQHPSSGSASGAVDPGMDELNLWASIGQWRLEREEFQAALVAYKRAESMTADRYIVGRLRLAQAGALARLDQAGPASAVLISLANETDARLSRPAMALLGTLKVQQGVVQQGFYLLRRAVEEDPTAMWPERAEAEADLGLAYLLMGDEASGLRWLHAGQKGFEMARKDAELVQSLENEAEYLAQAKKCDQADALRQRVAKMERTALL